MKIKVTPQGHSVTLSAQSLQSPRRRARGAPRLAGPCTAWALLLLCAAAPGCGPAPARVPPPLQVLSADGLKQLLMQTNAMPTLVHVWATWCPPCREEFSSVVRFHNTYGNGRIRVILVSADAPDKPQPVLDYLATQGAAFPSYIIVNPDAAFINVLYTNWSGSIPASFFYAPNGELKEWWGGMAAYDRYQTTADALLEHGVRRQHQ
jgi:thiol-disulfide isomerase/thioredoxin